MTNLQDFLEEEIKEFDEKIQVRTINGNSLEVDKVWPCEGIPAGL